MARFHSLFSFRFDELKNVVDGVTTVLRTHRTRYRLVLRKNLASLFIREGEFRLNSLLHICVLICCCWDAGSIFEEARGVFEGEDTNRHEHGSLLGASGGGADFFKTALFCQSFVEVLLEIAETSTPLTFPHLDDGDLQDLELAQPVDRDGVEFQPREQRLRRVGIFLKQILPRRFEA